VDVAGTPYRTIWLDAQDPAVVHVIDQRLLPHRFVVTALRNYRDGVGAIRADAGARCAVIGATAAESLPRRVRHATSWPKRLRRSARRARRR
jgi:methylthioribose-1-phosphate isomerase